MSSRRRFSGRRASSDGPAAPDPARSTEIQFAASGSSASSEVWQDGASESSASGSSKAIVQHSPHAFVQSTSALDAQDHNQLHQHFFIMSEEELASSMGLSGHCIVANGPLEILGVWAISAQALCLQFAVLYGMWMCVNPASECVDDPAGGTHGIGIMTNIAVYLHFMNVVGDMPFAVSIAAHFLHLRHTWQEVVLSAPIFLADALVVPIATAIIGALFLCKSLTAKDILLNSVAVAFVDGVDNWILVLSMKMKGMAGHRRQREVHIPYKPRVIETLDFIICVVPILPVVFSVGIAMIGSGMGLPC